MTTSFSIHCERMQLLAALQSADAIVPSTSAKPILTNIELNAANDQLEIVATDMQLGLRAVIRGVQITTPGSVIVPAKSLVSILKESKSAQVELTTSTGDNGNKLSLILSDGDYNIPIIVDETFPVVSTYPTDGDHLVLSGPDLERMLRKTAFAVDKDRSSAVLSGVLLSVMNEELVLAATDGKVLAESVSTYEGAKPKEDIRVIIPSQTITHLNRILASAKPDQIEVAIASKLVFIRVVIDAGDQGGAIQVELTSRLVEGSYPSYRNALPSSNQGTLTFDRTELGSAVKRTALMTSAATRGIILEVAGDQAEMSNLNKTSGTARIPLSCGKEGSDVRLGLNAQYVSEVLRAIDAEKITLELNGPGRGIIIREEANTYLIMPITLPN